jgi:ketosteroid isomerase-like protein
LSDDALHVTNLCHRIARLVDSADLAELEPLITDDIGWSMTGTRWQGRAQVLAGLAQMRSQGHAGPDTGTRHVITNLEVGIDGDRAVVRSYFQLLSGGRPAQVLVAGAYTDTMRRAPQGHWALAGREVIA